MKIILFIIGCFIGFQVFAAQSAFNVIWLSDGPYAILLQDSDGNYTPHRYSSGTSPFTFLVRSNDVVCIKIRTLKEVSQPICVKTEPGITYQLNVRPEIGV